MEHVQILSKKEVIIRAAELTVKSINVHYPPEINKTKYIMTKYQFDKLLQNLHLQNMGKTHLEPLELMF